MDYFFTPERALPADVGFSLWGRAHLIFLLLSAALVAAVCMLYRKTEERGRSRQRRILGAAVLACEAAKDCWLTAQGVMSVYYLPLHLCGIAVFLIFLHSLRGGETLGNFLYGTCMPGAACALLFPDWTRYPVWSFQNLLAFLSHALLVAYPLMLVTGGTLRPDIRRLPACLALLLCLGGGVYLFDRAFQANYMFLLHPAPGSPLAWFAGILGIPGYLAGYVPMLAAVWLLLYLPVLRSPPKTITNERKR